MKKKFVIINIILVLVFIITILQELHVVHYNRGNDFYNKSQFEEAIKEYNKALKLFPPKHKECHIRINLALSILQKVKNYDIKKDKNSILDILNNAEEVLFVDGCAHRNDNKGHSIEAEQLKNDIENMKKQLKEQSGDSEERRRGRKARRRKG